MKKEAQTYYKNKRSSLPYAEERSFSRIPFSKIDLNELKSVHITGVCGTAMASLAEILIQKGLSVTGSDNAFYPPMSTILENLGIEMKPFSIQNVKDKDIVIIGNACAPTNIEATYVRENNIPYFSIGETISELCIENKKSIVITGTHGKTTTTGLALTMLENISTDSKNRPSYLVGGAIESSGTSARYSKESDYFVIEGDEYDTAYFDKAPKFLHYKPQIAVLTSLELDHIDIYKDEQDYQNAFAFLIDELDEKGVLFACIDDIGVANLIKNKVTTKKIITYGKNPFADMRVTDIDISEKGQRVTFLYNQNKYSFNCPLFGEYNAMNALAVMGIGIYIGKDSLTLENVFDGYTGIKRRQEIFGEKNGVTVIDDFAHHPTAVQKTLLGLHERFGARRIIAIFEPRSNSSRSKRFEAEYGKAFVSADVVYISKPPEKKDGYNPDDFMDIGAVCKSIAKNGKEVHALEGANAIIENIKHEIKPGDVLVVMSNGSFDGIHQKLLNIL